MKPSKVEVWWVDTSAAGATLDQFDQETRLLSPQDIEGRRDESRWARIVLRFALSRYGDQELVSCPIEASAKGRPFLSGRDEPTFSISHSAGHVAVAIATGGPIGIDIERTRQIQMSANRQMQIAEQAHAHGLEVGTSAVANEAGNDFLLLWTKLEAFAKARGDGIGAVLTELKIGSNERPGNLFSKVGSADIQVRPLSLGSGFAGALVMADEVRALDTFEVPGNLSDLVAQFETNLSS